MSSAHFFWDVLFILRMWTENNPMWGRFMLWGLIWLTCFGPPRHQQPGQQIINKSSAHSTTPPPHHTLSYLHISHNIKQLSLTQKLNIFIMHIKSYKWCKVSFSSVQLCSNLRLLLLQSMNKFDLWNLLSWAEIRWKEKCRFCEYFLSRRT